MHPAGDPGAAALEATAADGGKEGSQRPADLERRRRCPPAAIAAVFGTSIITWDETQFPDPWNSKGRWVPNLGYAEIDGVWYEVVGAGGGHALLMDFGSLTCWEGRDGQTCCGYTAPDLRSKVGLAVTFYY